MSRRHQEGGLTLVELLLALVTLVVGGVWLLGAYQASIHLTEVSRQSSIAMSDLDDLLERIQATPFAQLAADFPDGAVNGVVGAGPDRYGAVIGGYGLASEQITVTHTPSAAADPRELVVQVSWTHRNRTYQRQLSTVRSSQAS